MQSTKTIIQDATKKVERFIKESEKPYNAPSFKESVKHFLHKSKAEANPKGKNDSDEHSSFEEEEKSLFVIWFYKKNLKCLERL